MKQQTLPGSLKALECFHAIMTSGSATAAASRLGLTQPAVSRLLGVLEEQLGFELFDRVKGRLIPTDGARALSGEVEIALQNVHRVSQLAQGIRDLDSGAITIVAPPSFSERILPKVVSAFIARHPGISIMLDSQDVAIACDKVALRAADCGFVRLPVDRPGLEQKSLLRSGTVCVIPARHRLAGKAVIQPRDLSGEPLVMLGQGRAVRAKIDHCFAEAGARMNVRIETRTVGAACAFAGNAVGITIVNEMLALQYQNEDVVLRRFSPEIVHEYAFINSARVPMSRITRRFLEFCETYFREHGNMLISGGTGRRRRKA